MTGQNLVFYTILDINSLKINKKKTGYIIILKNGCILGIFQGGLGEGGLWTL